MTTNPLPHSGRPVLQRLSQQGTRVALASVHLLTDLPVGIVAFVVTTISLVLSVSLLPLFLVGVLIFRGSGFLTRWMAGFERSRLRLLLDLDLPKGSAPSGLRAELLDGATWRMRGYLLLRLPLGIITFTVMLVAWALPLVLITLPLYGHRLPAGAASVGSLHLSGPIWMAVTVLVGLGLLAAAPFVITGLAAVDTALARSLIAGQSSAAMSARMSELEHSRARVVDAAAEERRRIERDLHDGAQQRLVALGMNLDRARARFDSDPAAARAIIDDAHAEVKTALVELRELTRGIHPAVLTDRGLDAALSGLASRSPIPIQIDVDLPGRCSPTIEAIAYFVASEALTNTARHSRATAASVTVRRDGPVLLVTVTDNGVGGADPTRGTGLAGLADRVTGVDGRFAVDSPAGGPTVIAVELPCAS